MTDVIAPLGFFRRDNVAPDTERTGLLRGATMDDPDSPEALEFHDCALKDWSRRDAPALHLDRMGFDVLDLSALTALQSLLEDVRTAGEITPAAARALRRELRGQVLRMSSGRRLRLLSIAPEGLIMRTAGPDGLQPDPDVQMSEMNGHGAAGAVHGDQDVRGTPLKQMMRGFAPWLFRHQTPDGSNRLSPLVLVNLWIPLDQITRPLTLMDRRSLDKRAHQLRYALPTDAFLDRDEQMRENDIWTFLYHEGQRWYFNPELDSRSAYVFDTLGTPHGSAILPGEAQLRQFYVALAAARDALAAGDRQRAIEAATIPCAVPCDSTEALRDAAKTMQGLLRELHSGGVETAQETDAWLEGAGEILRRVVRKSLEMRVVALLYPAWWPRFRARGCG